MFSTDLPLTCDRMDRNVWEASKQLAAYGSDVVQFEGARAVASILLFLTLNEDPGEGRQRQRDAGGGRYKRLMDSIGERQHIVAYSPTSTEITAAAALLCLSLA